MKSKFFLVLSSCGVPGRFRAWLNGYGPSHRNDYRSPAAQLYRKHRYGNKRGQDETVTTPNQRLGRVHLQRLTCGKVPHRCEARRLQDCERRFYSGSFSGSGNQPEAGSRCGRHDCRRHGRSAAGGHRDIEHRRSNSGTASDGTPTQRTQLHSTGAADSRRYARRVWRQLGGSGNILKLSATPKPVAPSLSANGLRPDEQQFHYWMVLTTTMLW